MTKRKRKKPKKQKQPAVQRELIDRVLIGMRMQAEPIGDDGFVATYILNPGIRGPRKLTVYESSTWPAFESLEVFYDDQMRKKLNIQESELMPFWMKRFVALTEEGLIFGYMRTPDLDRYRFEVKTLSFDYELTREVFGEFSESLKRTSISKELVLGTIETCVGLLAEGTGSQFKLTNSYVVDPGPGGWFGTKGGTA